MRLFFALWPTESVRRALWRQFRGMVRHGGGKPVPRHNLHLTLAFLGQVSPDNLSTIKAVADTVPVNNFNLQLDRCGYFPAAGSLWVGPRETPDKLTGLYEGLWRALLAAGFQREHKPFRPHVTLARKAQRAPAADCPGLTWPVDHFVLVQSQTHHRGARYAVLHRWPVSGEKGGQTPPHITAGSVK